MNMERITFQLALISSVLAGSPSQTLVQAVGQAPVQGGSKRSINAAAAKEYVTVTSYLQGAQYCLRNFGAAMAGLTRCTGTDLSDPMSVFQVLPIAGSTSRYLLNSTFDGRCVNFTSRSSQYFYMVDCSTEPWVNNWPSSHKEYAADNEYVMPKYAVLSAPAQGFVNFNNLASNQCYMPRTGGGVYINTCQNSLSMTWFAYSTSLPAPPVTNSVALNGTYISCQRWPNSSTSLSCDVTSDSIILRGSSDNQGRLASSTVNLPHIPASYPMKIDFGFTMDGSNPSGSHSNIFGLRGSGQLNITSLTTTASVPLNYYNLSVGLDGAKLQVIFNNNGKYTFPRNISLNAYSKVTIYLFYNLMKIELSIRSDSEIGFYTYREQFNLTANDILYSADEYGFTSPSKFMSQVANASVGPIKMNYLSKSTLLTVSGCDVNKVQPVLNCASAGNGKVLKSAYIQYGKWALRPCSTGNGPLPIPGKLDTFILPARCVGLSSCTLGTSASGLSGEFRDTYPNVIKQYEIYYSCA